MDVIESKHLFQWKNLGRILLEGIFKFNPITLIKNPVIFVTALAALALSINTFFTPIETRHFTLSITLWLWFTVYFANISEATAEVRNRAQAEALKKARKETTAHLICENGEIVVVSATALRKGDRVIVYQNEHFPSDGEIVAGSALIDESAFTGESEPVVRIAGSDFNSVMSGTKLLSEEITIRITADPGASYVDRMIELIESAERKKSPNEEALSVLLNGLTLIFFVMILSLQFFGLYYKITFPLVYQISLFVCLIPTTIGSLLSAVGIAGINRLMKRNVLAMSGQAIEAAGDVDLIMFDKTGTITVGNRRAHQLIPAEGVAIEELVECVLFSSLLDMTIEGQSIIELLEKEHKALMKPLPAEAKFFPFSAETRLCGVDIEGRSFRKGALDTMEKYTGKTISLFLKKHFQQIASTGGTPLIVGTQSKILGIVWLKDTIKEGILEKFSEFRALGIKTVMMTGDNHLTAQSVANEVGVDSFLANISPEAKLSEIINYQKKGLVVGMTGDGVNDAPALAQADISMAMNAGTQTAKEAANMIDLDSHPSKLFDVIEVGKQMLMTRGSLTTFSIANDLAKYFVIIPSMLVPYFPFFNNFNLMHLSSPKNALLSSVIYNALIIIALLPLAFKGVRLIPASANTILNRNLLIYGLGGVVLPFFGIKIIDLILATLFK